MIRYTGPRVRVIRALGVELPGLSRKKIERRPYPPEQHAQGRRARWCRRRRETEEKCYIPLLCHWSPLASDT
jgi:small subunit ribosomal protein S4